MSVPLPEWLNLFQSEYLADFLPSGGATFKVLVCDTAAAADVLSSVTETSRASGFYTAVVDACDTRVHMIDQIFTKVAQQVDWQESADRWLRQHLADALVTVPEEVALTDLEAIAEASGMDPRSLGPRINQAITRGIVKNDALWSEFRYGMGAYCVGRVADKQQLDEVVHWLRNERVSLVQLRSFRVRQRINRTNARPMLGSAAIWLRECGSSGLVVVLDLSRVFDDTGEPSLTRTRAALLDLYEIMRQFIDETDVSKYLAVIAVAGPGIVEDAKRSYNVYDAFKLRVVDDVRDPARDNPLNCMVRLSTDGSYGDVQ